MRELRLREAKSSQGTGEVLNHSGLKKTPAKCKVWALGATRPSAKEICRFALWVSSVDSGCLGGARTQRIVRLSLELQGKCHG